MGVCTGSAIFSVGINGWRKRSGDKDVATGGLVLGGFSGLELFENFAKILSVDRGVRGWIEAIAYFAGMRVTEIEKPDQPGSRDERGQNNQFSLFLVIRHHVFRK